MLLFPILIFNLKNVYLTIDNEVQKIADSILIKNSKFYKFSAILVSDIEKGRIIAISCYEGSKFNYSVCLNEKFPSASIFKIATAIASIEILNLNPDDEIYYSGKIYSERPYIWLSDYSERKQTFKLAFGLSNNPVFGRLAILVGSYNLYIYGKKLFFDVLFPQNDFSLALMGAGFVNAKIKPIDALKLMNTISNKGLVKTITIVDSISNFYYYRPRIEGRAFEETTFYKLKELFRETINNGTAKKFLKGYDVGGKTGSLYDRIHNGYIKWFVGFFPVDNPKYAFVSMIVEKNYNKNFSPIANIKPIIDYLSRVIQ